MKSGTKLVNGYLLVVPEEPKKVTDAGLTIPESMRGNYSVGRVAKSGSADIPAGHRVVFPFRIIRNELEWEGETYTVVHEDSVVLVAPSTRTYDLDNPEDQQDLREHFEDLREKGFAVRVEE